jgi:hypothetical protein
MTLATLVPHAFHVIRAHRARSKPVQSGGKAVFSIRSYCKDLHSAVGRRGGDLLSIVVELNVVLQNEQKARSRFWETRCLQ